MLKPLDQSKFAARIIKDLGMLTKDNNKRRMRYVELACCKCCEGFVKTVDNAIRRQEKLCDKCRFISDDDVPAKVLKYHSSQEVIFECNRCGLDFTMSSNNARKSNKYGLCRSCKDDDRNNELTTENIFKKLRYDPSTGSLTYKYNLSTRMSPSKDKELYVMSDGRVKFCGSRAVSKARLCLWLYHGYDVLEGRNRPIGFKNNDNTDYRIDNLAVGRVFAHDKRKYKYSKSEIRNAFLQCDYREQIKKRFLLYYRYTIQKGWYSELTHDIPSLRRRWSLRSAYKEAKKYLTREEFKRGNESAYDYIRHNYPHFRDRIYAHMEFGSKSDNDVIYVWKVTNLSNVYKIGVTSARLKDYRIKQVSKAASLDYSIIIMKKVNDALKLEKKLHGMFEQYIFDNKFDGHTEFRLLTQDDLRAVLKEIERYVDERRDTVV